MWCVYLLQCADGSYYCGIAKDFDNRLNKHNAGRGAKYTRCRLPVSLLVKVDGFTHSEALKLEYKVKRQPRQNKVGFLLNEARQP